MYHSFQITCYEYVGISAQNSSRAELAGECFSDHTVITEISVKIAMSRIIPSSKQYTLYSPTNIALIYINKSYIGVAIRVYFFNKEWGYISAEPQFKFSSFSKTLHTTLLI
jgi:hypothetical protein